jgi:hypothetical protein
MPLFIKTGGESMHTVTITICGILLTLLAAFIQPAQAETLPDKISIEGLKDLYGPVTFGHAQHIAREKDCAVCHHHTNGAPASKEECLRCHRGGHEVKSMGCKSCHEKQPFSAEQVNGRFKNSLLFHQDKPGLKASYHLSCLGCHKTKGAGPVACIDCHVLTSSGEAFYRTGKYAPDPGKAGKTGHH